MQVGDSSNQTPWEYRPEIGRSVATLATYRFYARLHLRLFPYVWTHAHNLKTGGRPILQPFGLRYPEQGEHPGAVYLLGDDGYIAKLAPRR